MGRFDSLLQEADAAIQAKPKAGRFDALLQEADVAIQAQSTPVPTPAPQAQEPQPKPVENFQYAKDAIPGVLPAPEINAFDRAMQYFTPDTTTGNAAQRSAEQAYSGAQSDFGSLASRIGGTRTQDAITRVSELMGKPDDYTEQQPGIGSMGGYSMPTAPKTKAQLIIEAKGNAGIPPEMSLEDMRKMAIGQSQAADMQAHDPQSESELQKRIDVSRGVNPLASKAREVFANAGQSALETMPLAAVPGVGFGLATALGSTIAGNQAITQGADAGLSGSDLAGFAGRQAFIEGGFQAGASALGAPGLEKMLAPQIAKFGVKPAIKAVVEGIAQEYPEEALTTAAQQYNEQFSGVTEHPDYLQGQLDTLGQVLATGGLVSPHVVGRGALQTLTGQTAAQEKQINVWREQGYSEPEIVKLQRGETVPESDIVKQRNADLEREMLNAAQESAAQRTAQAPPQSPLSQVPGIAPTYLSRLSPNQPSNLRDMSLGRRVSSPPGAFPQRQADAIMQASTAPPQPGVPTASPEATAAPLEQPTPVPTVEQPTATPEQNAATPKALTPEAESLLADTQSVPFTPSSNMVRIAQENGIEFNSNPTGQQVIDALQSKKNRLQSSSDPAVNEAPSGMSNTSDTAVSEGQPQPSSPAPDVSPTSSVATAQTQTTPVSPSAKEEGAGGDSTSGKRKEYTEADFDNVNEGTTLYDSEGNEYYLKIGGARFGKAQTFPIKDGKPNVSSETRIDFAITDSARDKTKNTDDKTTRTDKLFFDPPLSTPSGNKTTPVEASASNETKPTEPAPEPTPPESKVHAAINEAVSQPLRETTAPQKPVFTPTQGQAPTVAPQPTIAPNTPQRPVQRIVKQVAKATGENTTDVHQAVNQQLETGNLEFDSGGNVNKAAEHGQSFNETPPVFWTYRKGDIKKWLKKLNLDGLDGEHRRSLVSMYERAHAQGHVKNAYEIARKAYSSRNTENPYTPSAEETAGMNIHAANLVLELDDMQKQMNTLSPQSKEYKEMAATADKTGQELRLTANALAGTNSEAAYVMRMSQTGVDIEDLSLHEIYGRKEASLGRQLSATERADMEKLKQEVEELRSKMAARDQEATATAANDIIKEVKKAKKRGGRLGTLDAANVTDAESRLEAALHCGKE